MSVVENFLTEIFRRLRSKNIGIIIDGENLSFESYNSLPQLREKVKEIGEIRIAEVMYENKIPKKDFQELRESGFTDIVVPGNIELSYLLEVYDLVLDDKVDFIVLGTHRDELIPLYTELRKSVTVFAFVESLDHVSKAFVESFDGIIQHGKVEEFKFNSHNFNELDQIIQESDGETKRITDYTGEDMETIDDANIGTFSEEIIEDDQLIEDMKKENKSK